MTITAAPGDFTVGGTLTIPAEHEASSGSVTLTAVDDNTDAPNKERKVLATAVNGQGIVQPSGEDLIIVDDEPAADGDPASGYGVHRREQRLDDGDGEVVAPVERANDGDGICGGGEPGAGGGFPDYRDGAVDPGGDDPERTRRTIRAVEKTITDAPGQAGGRYLRRWSTCRATRQIRRSTWC